MPVLQPPTNRLRMPLPQCKRQSGQLSPAGRLSRNASDWRRLGYETCRWVSEKEPAPEGGIAHHINWSDLNTIESKTTRASLISSGLTDSSIWPTATTARWPFRSTTR